MAVSALNAVLIGTRDGKRLVAFYRDRLGMPLREESHGSAAHWGCFLAGLHFAIHEERDAAPSSRIGVSFAVDDVDQTIADLREGGVPIVEEPIDRPFGRLASVRDPDGNLVYLHKYPARC